MHVRKILPAVVAVMLATAACHHHSGAPEAANHDHGAGFAFGEPGDPADAAADFEIEATDALEFEPSLVELDTGQTVTFTVSNAGSIDHEFVLGDDEYQESHVSEMSGDTSHEGPNAVSLPPGSTEEVTWTFTEAGEFTFACHVADHFEAGMFGTVDVRE